MDWLLGGHGRHTLREGRHGPDDIILYRTEKRKGDEWWAKVSHTFSYTARDDEVITEVLAEDQWDDDTGGNPELISGGVGCREVTVKVTSRVNRGFKFHFYVYGYKVFASILKSITISIHQQAISRMIYRLILITASIVVLLHLIAVFVLL